MYPFRDVESGGGHTSTTPSINSDDQSHSPPAAVGASLGTPFIPGEDDDDITTPRRRNAPTPPEGSDRMMAKKPKSSLAVVMGEPAPEPPRSGTYKDAPSMGNNSFASSGHQEVTPKENEPISEDNPALGIPRSGEEEATPASSNVQPQTLPSEPTHRHVDHVQGGKERSLKLSCTQWVLIVVTIFLFILVGILVWVFTVGPGSAANGGGLVPDLDTVVTSPPTGNAATSPPTIPPLPQLEATTSPSTPFEPKSPTEPPTEPPTQRPPTPLITAPPSTTSPSSSPSSPPSTSAPTAFLGSETLSIINDRGALRCGVMPNQDGFSKVNVNTNMYEGFEVDLCRAIAVAALGPESDVEFVEVTATERFLALKNGEVDLLASHTTHTMERDVYEVTAKAGFSFSVPYLYDGLTFGGLPPYGDCADRLDTTGNCTGLRICAVDGSTHIDQIGRLIEGVALVSLPTLASAYETLSLGFCNAIAAEQFEVAETVVRSNGYTGAYEVGINIYSREPLSLVTRDDDPRWSDMVQWVLQGILAAEERGILQATASNFVSLEYFGDSFTEAFRNVIAEVGNYAEIYDRHLRKILPRAEVNKINGGDSGLIFSLPFGTLQTNGPGPIEGGTLSRIVDRGHLRCGITRSPGFGEFIDGKWQGLDVDFCKAVSAAIFNGVSDDIDYRVLPAVDRFTALANGNVDILSRTTTWNIERDVEEATTGIGFSFSQPNFYDGVAVGGVPPYGLCADTLDTTSTPCQGLLLCVNNGTTTLKRTRELFAERFIVVKLTIEDAIQGLSTGECNAVVGGIQQIVEPSVRGIGYLGPYQTGVNRFTKDPLAVVTRQDDTQFSAFVNWIVISVFYAEEAGISQATSSLMPQVALFGTLYGRMLIDAIQSVGNYGEIYARNVEALVPRAGLNSANVNPYTAQHYPLPGI